MASVGWYRPPLARKWHYFMRRMALCGGYRLLSSSDSMLRDDHHESRFNCKACMEKRDEMFAVREA
jgi:hypothetical protein